MRFDCEPMAILPEAVSSLVMMQAGMGPQADEVPQPYLLSDASGQPIEWSAAGQMSGTSGGLLAVIPLMGALSPEGEYGGTPTTAFARAMAQADASAAVSTILIHARGPGGTVTGTPEAADAVRAVRDGGRTRVVTIADAMMASATTWIGTAAEEVVITPSGQAGSIGVITVYAERSKMLEEMGVKVDVIRNPSLKARFTGVEPLTEEMRATMEESNLRAYNQFKRAMADNRKVRVDSVESRFGGGEMMSAEEAKEAGLVDRIATVDATLTRLLTRPQRRAPARSRAELAKARLPID